jgi:hypothetical protein
VVRQVSSSGTRWFALVAMAVATARCGGDAFTADPPGSSPDASPPADAAHDDDTGSPAEASVADAALGLDATADAGSGEDGGRSQDGGRRDASAADAGSPEDATVADAESGDAGSKDAGGSAYDGGPTDARAIETGAGDGGEDDAAACEIPCGTACCGAGEQCCGTLQLTLDGGSLVTSSCRPVSNLACIAGATPEGN